MTRQRVLSVVVRLVVLLVLAGGQAGGSMAVRAAPQAEQAQVVAAAASRPGPDAGTPGLPAGATTHAVLQLGSAPEDLDIAGPGTLEIRQTAPFTATVSPPTASVPITFTWVTDGHSPYEEVSKGRESTHSLGWSVEGTHLITITAANAAGSITRVRRVRVVPPPRPDLAITGIYYNGDDLYYQIMNAGDLTVTVPHTSTLWVNGVQTDSDPIAHTSIGPGQRLKRVFTHVPICSGTSHAFRVVVDAGDDVDESDELNNEWRQVVPCDARAPAINRGPAAFDVAQTSATIRWNTDEDADSTVLYGVRRGAFNWTARDGTLTTAHAVNLTGLRPGVTYEYKVQSADAAGNVVESRSRTFETLPPPVDPPPTPTVTMAPDPDHPGAYLVEATFDDASTVAQVAFLLNGEPIGTDYGRRAALEDVGTQGSATVLPQATPPPVPAEVFKTSFVPYKRGYSRDTFLSTPQKTITHQVVAQVVTWDQHLYVVPVELQIPSTSEPLNVELEIENPPPDYKIYITGDHTPGGTLVPLQVHAVQYDWVCEYAAWSTEADCSEVMHAVESVQVYQGASLIEHLFPSDEHDYEYQATLDMSNRPPGSYQVKVRALDTEGQAYLVETYVEVVQQLPSLDLTREVDRFGNRLRVRLTVANLPQATGAAHLHEVRDFVRSFQVASNHELGYEVFADYYWGTGADAHENAITIDFPQAPGQTYDLDPGESVVLEYWMVPIMYEDGTTFEIGHKDVEVTYHGPSGETHTSAFVRDWLNEQHLASPAFEDADYVIVTHPENLAWRNGFSNDVDRLLMTMADLARLKSGVLGYLESDNPRQILDDLVSTGGAWAERLDPAFQTVGGGHLLIVGEQEIVPAWRIESHDVDLSDQPYSDTGGSSAPDMATGRIIGNTAADLIKPLQASIDVWTGAADFDRSKAWLITGGGEGQDTFAEHIDQIQDILYSDVGISTHAKTKAIDYHAIASIAYPLSTGDAFALGRLTGAAIDDGVVADRSADVIQMIDPTTGALLDSLAQTYDSDDALAVGNVLAWGNDEIVMGDLSSNQIHVFGTGGMVSFDPAPYGFGPASHFALGDADGDGLEEILVASPLAFSP
ncbi:MAG: CARDB domain-containing protein, partial [Anaerolineae bacterium]